MKNIISCIESEFGVQVESKEIENILFLRVHGMDTMSLSSWLEERFLNINVGVKYRRLDKFCDSDWIIIEEKESLCGS